MVKSEFNVLFVINSVVTRFDLKEILEKVGIKVTLPMSHGDPILFEYTETAYYAPEEEKYLTPNPQEEKPVLTPQEIPEEQKKKILRRRR